jgi:hypothetical protein
LCLELTQSLLVLVVLEQHTQAAVALEVAGAILYLTQLRLLAAEGAATTTPQVHQRAVLVVALVDQLEVLVEMVLAQPIKVTLAEHQFSILAAAAVVLAVLEQPQVVR